VQDPVSYRAALQQGVDLLRDSRRFRLIDPPSGSSSVVKSLSSSVKPFWMYHSSFQSQDFR
jgi:hypothetical protein